MTYSFFASGAAQIVIVGTSLSSNANGGTLFGISSTFSVGALDAITSAGRHQISNGGGTATFSSTGSLATNQFNTRSDANDASLYGWTNATVSATVVIGALGLLNFFWRGDYRRMPVVQYNGSADEATQIKSSASGNGLLTIFKEGVDRPTTRFRRSRSDFFFLSDVINCFYKKTGGGAYELTSRPHQNNDGLTWHDRGAWSLGNAQSDFWNINLFGAPTGPQTFTQDFTATFTPTSALTKFTTHGAFAATLSFVGTFAKGLFKLLSFAATLSFSGAVQKQAGKIFAATLNFAGALKKAVGKGLSATLAPSGSLIKKLFDAGFTATLSFAGGFARSLLKMLGFSATLSFTGAMQKQTGKPLSATLSFVGALIKKTIDSGFTATLSFSGSIIKKLIDSGFTATLNFSGTFVRSFLKLQAFSATLSFAGAIRKQTNKQLSATLNFIGAIGRQIGKALSATLSFAGALGRKITHLFAATLSFIGNFATQFSGGAAHYTQAFTATLAPTATLIKRTVHGAFTATLSFVGALVRARLAFKALTATLSFAGALRGRTGKTFAATLSFTGALRKTITKGIAAVLSFIGALFVGGARTLFVGMKMGSALKTQTAESTLTISATGSQVAISKTASTLKISATDSNLTVQKTE